MFDLSLDIQPETAARLKKILELAADPEAFAQKLIACQTSEIKRGILNVRLDLKDFEDKYQLSTADFYMKFQQGATDDREDYVVWAGLYEMLQKNEKRLRELE